MRSLVLLGFIFAVGLTACEPVDVNQVQTTTTAATSADLPPVVTKVLVAKKEIETGTKLSDAMVEVVEIPKRHFTPDMLASESRGDVIGRAVLRDLPEGALLHDRDFEGIDLKADVMLEPIVVLESESPQRMIPDKATAALIAKGREAYLGTLTIEPGAGVPQHRDPTEEFLYVIEGGGTITIDGKSYELKPDMGVFMPADAEVSFQNGDAQTRVVQVFAGPGPASKYDSWTAVGEEESDGADAGAPDAN